MADRIFKHDNLTMSQFWGIWSSFVRNISEKFAGRLVSSSRIMIVLLLFMPVVFSTIFLCDRVLQGCVL